MNIAGIIFSNIYDNAMGELTKHRTVASVPFGGRYRLIDFVLSNMSNSNISSVGIITKYNYRSLMDHLGNCSEWDLDRKNGGVVILPPFSTGPTTVYRGNLEALGNAIPFLESQNCDYVVLCDTTVVCSIDFEEVVEAHKASGADVTVIANREKRDYVCNANDLFISVSDHTVTDLVIGQREDPAALIGMGMFVMERKYLLRVVRSYVARGRYLFERDYLQKCFVENTIKINVFSFDKTVLRNQNIVSYFQNNFRLFDRNVRKELFFSGAPVYTKVRDEAPAYLAPGSKMNQCVLADGCVISGNAENSVIFRDVIIEAGATVRNCILMQGTRVCRGASIDHVITDKNVVISENRVLTGAASAPLIINKNMHV